MLSALSFLDMLLQFRTGYVDKKSKIVINPKRVRRLESGRRGWWLLSTGRLAPFLSSGSPNCVERGGTELPSQTSHVNMQPLSFSFVGMIANRYMPRVCCRLVSCEVPPRTCSWWEVVAVMVEVMAMLTTPTLFLTTVRALLCLPRVFCAR